MAFERPTLPKLVKRARADIATRLVGADAHLRASAEEVLAITLSGMTHGLHGHLKWLSKQLLPDLADDEFLLRWASIFGLDRTAAVTATGEATITGTNTTVSPDETVWQRGDGTRYVQRGDATIASGTATVTLEAEEGGDDGNADVGTALEIAAPVAGINSAATVSGSGLSGGTDLEELEDLRTRLLLRLRNPPTGGGPGDYVNWALEVAGVTRAWETANLLGLGTVGVRFVRDNDTPSLIPDAGEVATVQAYIETKRPITADLTVLAPVAVTLDFTIEVTPDTVAIRAAVEAELRSLLLRVAEPGATIYLSQVNEAISLATGETDHTTTVPAADVTHAASEIAIFGSITWL